MTVLEQSMMMLSMTVKLRPAVQEDVPKLEWYGQYTHYRNLFRRAYRDQMQGKRLMLIADVENFPIGHVFIQFVHTDNDGGWGYLYSLRVMDMFQGHGIGTRLIREAEARIEEHDLEWSTIAVAKDNPAARRLYERLGYDIFGEDSGQWSYIDHEGRTRQVSEPCFLLQKQLILR
jgi:ribosomal protein S18 acetylase RimI-like enzyme